MEILEQISEDQVIAEFLKGEINSKRFGKKILRILDQDNRVHSVILNPNFNNEQDNLYRRILLGKTRGYGKNREMFQNFPKDVIWSRALFHKRDLAKVKYINYSYWKEISNNTRLPREAAKKIIKGEKTFDVSNELFFDILSLIEQKERFTRMIFVARNRKSRVVILEGHARLTAYFIAPEYIPKSMEVFIGFSDEMPKWGLY